MPFANSSPLPYLTLDENLGFLAQLEGLCPPTLPSNPRQAAKSISKLYQQIQEERKRRIELEALIAQESEPTQKDPTSRERWQLLRHFQQRLYAKFGDAVRGKSQIDQLNEILCKVLCHIICVVDQAMFELGIEPTFCVLSKPI